MGEETGIMEVMSECDPGLETGVGIIAAGEITGGPGGESMGKEIAMSEPESGDNLQVTGSDFFLDGNSEFETPLKKKKLNPEFVVELLPPPPTEEPI